MGAVSPSNRLLLPATIERLEGSAPTASCSRNQQLVTATAHTLMTLPLEIRLKIYHLVTPVFLKIRQCSEGPARSGEPSADNLEDYISAMFRPSLLLVSRQVYAEVKSNAREAKVVLVGIGSDAFLTPSDLPTSILERVQSVLVKDFMHAYMDMTFGDDGSGYGSSNWYLSIWKHEPPANSYGPVDDWVFNFNFDHMHDTGFPVILCQAVDKWLRDERMSHTSSIMIPGSEFAKRKWLQPYASWAAQILKQDHITIRSIAYFEVRGRYLSDLFPVSKARFKAVSTLKCLQSSH